jgi:hypothetical protein
MGGLLALAAPQSAGGTFKPLRPDEAPDPRDRRRRRLRPRIPDRARRVLQLSAEVRTP